MHRPGAKVHSFWFLAVSSHLQSRINQLGDAFIFTGRDGNDRNAQGLLHFTDFDGAAVGPHLIHHVQRNDHGNVQFYQLQAQIKIPFDVGSINDINNAVRMRIDQKIPRYDFFTGIGRKGVNAGKIHNHSVFVAADKTVLAFHCNAWEIAHMLIGSGKLIEKGRLTAVLIACQCKSHAGSSSISIFFASSSRRVSS